MKMNLNEFSNLLLRVILKTPVEVIVSVLFLILSVYISCVLGEQNNTVWLHLRTYFCVCFGVTYACNFLFRKGKVRVVYYATLLLPVLYYFYLDCNSISSFVPVITTLCVVLLMLVARGESDNTGFTYSSISLALNLGMACALAIASVLAMMSILFSISYIFDVARSTHITESIILSLGVFVIAPFLFLFFEQTPYSKQIKGSRFLELLFNYILIPAILIYGAILYAYFAKIIVLGSLPKGVISATAIAFLAGGFVIKAGRVILNHKSANWFFDYFPFISLPAIGMLWVSSMVRILEYGFTGDRLYLLLAVIVLTVLSLAPLCKRLNVYRYLLSFTMIIFLVFTYVPGIKADDLDKKAKVKEVVEQLPIVQQEKIISGLPYLQNPLEGGVTIMWQTDLPAYCWVEYGQTGDDGKIIGEPKVARNLIDGQVICNNTVHRVRLENLCPDKKYQYRVCAKEILEYKAYKKVFGACDSTDFYSFKLPAPLGEDFTAVIFNDLHKDVATLQALCGVLGGMEYDFVIFNGDCVDDPVSRQQATAFMIQAHKLIGAYSKPVFYVRGNHEIRGAYSMGLRELIEYPGDKTYGAFSWGDTRFVILDCGEDKPDEHPVYYGLNDFTMLRNAQKEFLEAQMQEKEFKKAVKRVLVHHIPVYGNTDDYQPCRDIWGDILAKAPFTLSVNGHVHKYARYAKGEIGYNFPVYVGGGPKLENATVMVLEKRGKELQVRVLDAGGKEICRDIL